MIVTPQLSASARIAGLTLPPSTQAPGLSPDRQSHTRTFCLEKGAFTCRSSVLIGRGKMITSHCGRTSSGSSAHTRLFSSALFVSSSMA